MVRIELDVFEQKDILEYLQYALEQKELNKPVPNPNLKGGGSKFDTTNYDVQRIKQLMKQISNPKSRVNIYKSANLETQVSRENSGS